MHNSVMAWAGHILTPEMVTGKIVVEAGAYNVNGSLRPMIESMKPRHYLATDVRPGPGVDRVVDAADLGPYRADLMVSTEMLEHCGRWADCLFGMIEATDPGGYLLLTTRSPGFSRHDHPGDHWRWTVPDMARVLVQYAGLDLLDLQADPDFPGVFALARRREIELAGYMPAGLASAV